MKCQSCGKKEATVKYYENINGKSQKLYFCEECANKLGISNFGEISDLFSPIFATMPEFNLLEKRKCPVCGYTLEDYSTTGMLGCENCYNVFEKNMDNIFYKIHGKNRHIKLAESKKNKKEKPLSEYIGFSYIIPKFDLDIKKMNIKYVTAIISLINALIISVVVIILGFLDWNITFKMLLSFLLSFTLIYICYEALGKSLVKKGWKK